MNRRIPSNRLMSVVVLWCFILGAPTGYGQQIAEQYIPIGYSPGVSGKYSYIGPIVAVDRDAHTISVDENGQRRVIKVTGVTRIWLDRSKRRRENRVASEDDCEVGRMIEVMYLTDAKESAAWIKIESR
ncbi:MAG: hypothetical protein ACR2Q3_11940 [Woeseiaceae bacterium]